MKIIAIIFSLILTSNAIAQMHQTVYEKSGGKETPTYQQVIDYYSNLANFNNQIMIKEMGMTDSGLPLHLVILDSDKDFDFEQSYKKDKTIILINNGIHPGEPDGIDASMMLARDLLKKKSLIKNVVIGIIPIYNIGGALNRNTDSRANQNGPVSYGFRGNARNFDLNRDFVKSDTRNAQSFAEIFHMVNPDIFIDTHVSNGADYQYSITHLATQHNKLGGALGKYIEDEFTPQLEKKMNIKGSEITPYVNVYNRTPDKEGFSQFLDNPRYSTGYTALFHTLGFMIETHMLKPFNIRVKATYNFLESIVELAQTDGKKIRQLKLKQQESRKAGDKHPVSWKLDRSKFKNISFKGYEGEIVKSEVTGLDRLKYDHSKPFTKEIPYYNHFIAQQEVTIPRSYIIPRGWHSIIELLRLNKIELSTLSQDTTIKVEAYRIEDYKTASSPYEGHYLHRELEVSSFMKNITFKKGDYVITTNQKAWRYLVETLEPQATDSFFNWNFFDTILQRKEGFSSYVFEDEAVELLKKNKSLSKEYEAKKTAEPDFAKNAYSQLNYIYMNSDHYEKAHLSYPIYRVLK